MNAVALSPLVKAEVAHVRRELAGLIGKKLVVKRGGGRGVTYAVKE